MKLRHDKKILGVFAAFSIVVSIALFQNCGSSGGGGGGGGSSAALKAMPAGLGTFVDDPVAGISYTTSSGLSGVTNSLGQFQFNPGDTVTFYALGVQLGTAAPTIANDGTATVTPVTLVPGATDVTNPQVTQLAQFLNTLNAISVSTGGGSGGTFVVPTSSSLQTQLGTLNTSASNITQAQLQSALDAAFGSGTYTVTSASSAQTTLQNGINAASIAGTVWSGSCSCNGGATLYFQSNGVINGITWDGNVITGTWSMDSSGKVSFQGATPNAGYGTGGVISAGASTGTLQIYKQDGTYQGVLTVNKVVSSGQVTNSSWIGSWVVNYTPNAYGQSLGDNGGCANVVASASTFYGVTNDGNYFTGGLDSSGNGSTSFPDSHGTNTLNFNLGTSTGTVSENGQVKGTLAFSRSGTCSVTKNSGGSGGSSGPSPGPTTSGTSSPTPTPAGSTSPSPSSSAAPTATPVPSPSPFSNGQQVHMNITWANTPMSVNSIIVTLNLSNSSGTNVGMTQKSESSNSTIMNGTPINTSDDIVTTSNQSPTTWTLFVSPCTASQTSGIVNQNNPVTVSVTCN